MAGMGRCAERNEALHFRHARFEMSVRHPSRDEVETDIVSR